MKVTKRQLKKIIKEELETVMDEGFFGRMGDKIGFETGTTKGRAKVIGILVNNWKEAVEDARYMDQDGFNDLMTNTGKLLKAANFEPEKIAQILIAIGSGDGTAAADAYLAAAQDVQMRGGAGSDLITLFHNGVPEIVAAVGEEEARRSAQATAEKFAALNAEWEKEQKFRGQEADAEMNAKYGAADARNKAKESARLKKLQTKGRGDY